MKQWEVWHAKFPYEEDISIEKERPVIILNVDTLECLSVKVTSHKIRNTDQFDTPIKYWKEAGLNKPSIARVSKVMNLSKDKFINKKGILHKDDIITISEQYKERIARYRKVMMKKMRKNRIFDKIWKIHFPKRKKAKFSETIPRSSMIAAHHRFSYPEETNKQIKKIR